MNEDKKSSEKADLKSKVNKLFTSDNAKPVDNKSLTIGILLGIAGAALGAGIWYSVARIFDLRIGYLAILIGLFVGFGMRISIKRRDSIKLGLVAAGLAIFGIILGTYLIWFFELPRAIREQYVAAGLYTQVQAEEAITAESVHEKLPFFDYVKNDLTSSDSEHNLLIVWLFYILAVYIAFGTVYEVKKKSAI
jgi:hypothetical protein